MKPHEKPSRRRRRPTQVLASNKNNHVISSTIGVICSVLMHVAMVAAQATRPSTQISHAHAQATFSTPSQAINITHIAYDHAHDLVYVGATNYIYQLNASDLSEQHEQETGPVMDHASCGITECQGYEELMKLTTNVNKVLVIDYERDKLLACGSTKQGACRRYELGKIGATNNGELIPMAVAANDDNSSTYAFIAPARYDTSAAAAGAQLTPVARQQNVLYVASTYTKVGQSRDLLVPAIGTRMLDDGPNLLRLYENSFLDNARIDISSHLRDYFLVNYKYGFASQNYIYFVTVQRKATSRDYEELGYHTRLARICITDSSYNSYTEVDLVCKPQRSNKQQQQQQQPSDFPLLQDAILVDAGSHLLQSLAQQQQQQSSILFGASQQLDDQKVLLGVFSSARDHTQHAGEHSAVCAFSLSQIEDKFNDNIHMCYTGKMQSRNMEYIAGNVQECPKQGQGGNVVNFCHETLKINGTLPIVAEAAIQYDNTTLTAITATSQLLSSSSSKQQSPSNNNNKMQQTTSSQPHTVAFLGTSNGHIKKVLLNNATNGVEFEDVQLDSNAILADLHLHASGKQLIAATAYKVMSVPTHNCQQHATCRECSQSRNPYCGWCSLKRSCTTRSECNIADGQQQQQQQQSIQQQRQPLKWISSDSPGKCIELHSIVPDKIPITSTGKVDLYIERLPRLSKEQLQAGIGYKCVFDAREHTSATQTAFGLTCPLPKLMHRPKIQPGRDHAVVDLAVRSSETNADFLNGKVTFFECQLHTTCKDCLTTNWGCNWCLNENICLFNTSKCEKTGAQQQQQQLQTRQDNSLVQLVLNGPATTGKTGVAAAAGSSSSRSANTINQVHQCPTFDVGHKQDIVIADGSEKELTIRVKNMPQIKGNINCIVELENDKIPLKARIEDADRIVCEGHNYSYAADVGMVQGQLVVVYSDQNIFIDRTNFTVYKCHLLGAYLSRPDCSLCQRIDARFECAWCSGACSHRARCSARRPDDDTCPPPRIDSVHPLAGPTQGGTRVTIEGSNLGMSFEEIARRVSIGNVPCKPLEHEYKPSNKIVCVTGRAPVAAETSAANIAADIMVGNRAGYTVGPTKFHYKHVHLADFQPRYGPQSGGTRLTLHGLNLNVGSHIQIFLDELACALELGSVQSEQLVCKTPASRYASRAIRQLKLIVDEAQIELNAADSLTPLFYYTQDPTVTKIAPLKSYMSGGRPINVFGTNLTAVQAPRLAIVDAAGKSINETLCVLHDDTRMQCPSPGLAPQLMDIEWAEQHIGSGGHYEPQSWLSSAQAQQHRPQQPLAVQNDDAVKFRVSLIMDNVAKLRDLQQHYPHIASEIAYTSDPKLYAFASSQYKESAAVLGGTEVQVAPAAGDQRLQQQQQQQQAYQIDADTFLLQPGEPSLVLYGEHLRTAVSEYEIAVTVGQDLCNLTVLQPTRLVCVVPLNRMAAPTDEDGHQTPRGLPMVVVRIGFNLRYELGYVQYHPQLVEQILANFANLTHPSGLEGFAADSAPRFAFPGNYMPAKSESFLHQIASAFIQMLSLLIYAALIVLIVSLLYSLASSTYKARKRNYYEHEYKRMQSRISSLEKSVEAECRLSCMALQSDLNELVRHVELSGVPLLGVKHYIMKVFFPGINNHPLLHSSSRSNNLISMQASPPQQQHQQQQQQLHHIARPLSQMHQCEPLEAFERLILNKSFLVTLVNTLEAQPTFSIRDKVNVGSLIMIALIDRLDYATDILRTLLFQLVERSVAAAASDYDADGASLLKRQASNLLGALPIGKRASAQSPASPRSFGRMVGGSASSLMQSTQVAAQMLLSRVNKNSPLHKHQHMSHISQQTNTTAFHTTRARGYNARRATNTVHTIDGRKLTHSHTLASSSSPACWLADANKAHTSSQMSLMLRRTDSVVEKMLTNWLALNMYDYFRGDVGHSLYLLFEALKCQLERGPIDSMTGDAYYSLNELKLLREPAIQFDVVSLYVIVDADIALPAQRNTLLTESLYNLVADEQLQMQQQQQQRAANNTITLALRVLDCDTISQIKSKILCALYRNAPYSTRLSAQDVELVLRQPHQPMGQCGLADATLSRAHNYSALVLRDEDETSVHNVYNGRRHLNTLRHYRIVDQAIMMLSKRPQQQQLATTQRTQLTDMLDENYNNPYSEIQYGVAIQRAQQQQQQHPNNNNWHLVQQARNVGSAATSDTTSGASHSPSIMLLNSCNNNNNSRPQYLYHQASSSSSTSSATGNALDTHSTTVDSASTRLQQQQQQQQNIYCQISDVRGGDDQTAGGGGSSSYYSQLGNVPHNVYARNICMQQQQMQQQQQQHAERTMHRTQCAQTDREQQIYLSRMLTSKGTVQEYIDNFMRTVLNARANLGQETPFEQPMMYGERSSHTISHQTSARRQAHLDAACPPAVKWLFDLLDEAALENGVSDARVIHAWKSNAFLMRFWLNIIKNPNYVLDIEKSNTLDANLSVIAQTLMDACAPSTSTTDREGKAAQAIMNQSGNNNKLLFAKDVPKYQELVKHFYMDVAAMRPVNDKDIVKQMDKLSASQASSFDKNIAIKELCVYAVNYGPQLADALRQDCSCQQMDLAQQLEQCFRSLDLFEAYT